MASWPTQSDYKDSLQNPDTAFRDDDLKLSAAERSPMGVPKARSGAFASVYKMTGPKGVVALKLFNFPNEDRAQRYKAVSDYLEKELGPKKPPCVVKFQYHTEGIRVGKGWFPTLTMAWVKGVSLGEWVRQTVEKKNPDVAAVRNMADLWCKLVQQLQENKIAHGDLQHDNVMVVNDQPVLVDYDGMCVPALDPPDPTKKLEQLEFGKPAYQHPARCVEKLSGQLDNFSAWIILVALRAIAADPKLYIQYVLKTENENLLFTANDMQVPDKSVIWPDLMRCKDPDVSGWARMIRESLDKPFAKIPPFTLDPFDRLRKLVSAPSRDTIQIEAEADRLRKTGKTLPPDIEAQLDPFAALRGMLAGAQRPWPQIKAEIDRLKKVGKTLPRDLQDEADPLKRLKALCAATIKDWAAVAAEGASVIAGGEPLPPDLKRAVDDARTRVDARDRLKAALDAGDARAVVTVYKPALVNDWVDPGLVNAAKDAAGQVVLLDKLKAAAAVPGDGKALIKLWDDSSPKLGGIAEAQGYGRTAEGFRARIRAAEDFLRVFQQPGASERAVADAWQAVVSAGPMHPTLNASHQRRGEDAARWAPLIDKLRRVPFGASYDNDREMVSAWGTGAALAGCREATEFAGRAQEANGRLALVQALERAIKAAEAGAPGDGVMTAAAKLPPGYPHPFEKDVRGTSDALKMLGEIEKVLAQEFPSDRKVVAAFKNLMQKNPKLAKQLDKANPAMYAQVEASVQRRKLFDQFGQIDAGEPRADKQDEKWLQLWAKHRDVLKGRRDAEELKNRFTLAKDRYEKWKKLKEALDARDMFALRRRYQSYADALHGYPPLVEKYDEIQALLVKADQVVAVQDKLTGGGVLAAAERARQLWDFLRDNHDAFGPDMKVEIERQVKTRLAGDARLVPAFPAYQLTGTRNNLVKACWSWGGHGLISYCAVGVDGRKFLANPDDADPYSRMKCKPEDHQREGGGITVVPPPGSATAYVTIWPVVELGWTTVHGPPLTVGPVPVGRR